MKIIVALILILTIFVSGCISFSLDKHITIDCDTCDANTTDIDDCVAYYENNKDSIVVQKITEKFDIDVNKINVTKIEKTISYPSKDVGCKYYFELVK